jgi:hypothetical protein
MLLVGGLLYFLHTEYSRLRNEISQLPGITKDLTILLYCTFIGWKCPDPLKIPKVIGGMIQDVGNARDVFELIAELGSTGVIAPGHNHVEYSLRNASFTDRAGFTNCLMLLHYLRILKGRK